MRILLTMCVFKGKRVFNRTIICAIQYSALCVGGIVMLFDPISRFLFGSVLGIVQSRGRCITVFWFIFFSLFCLFVAFNCCKWYRQSDECLRSRPQGLWGRSRYMPRGYWSGILSSIGSIGKIEKTVGSYVYSRCYSSLLWPREYPSTL